jgi:prophage DNA circulation protein
MPQIQQAMARLRLLLADIESKSQQVQAMTRQFRAQLRRLPQQAIYGRTTLEGVLSIMAEIEDRLADAEAAQRRLDTIRARAQGELEALQLLLQVEEARKRLASLKGRAQETVEVDEETRAEIRQLEAFIASNSQRAGRAITGSE